MTTHYTSLGRMEAHLVALEEPCGIKSHHRVLKGHPAAMEAPSGVLRFTMEAHPEALRFTLKPLRITRS
jgi:hypothetical protein